ncbi:MAG: hypothetical protein N4A40_02100 [Tissierellales bacterium]|jgi:hypothetical protein|nr:hypothetical protein [Tissierellales bacterium]
MNGDIREIGKVFIATIVSIMIMYLGLFVASTVFIGIIVLLIGIHIFVQIRDLKYVSRAYYREFSFRNPILIILLDVAIIIAVLSFSPIFKRILFAVFTIGLLINFLKMLVYKR